MRLLTTPDAAAKETAAATIKSTTGRAPVTRNCCITRSSEPGGTTWLSTFSSMSEKNWARVCTRMATAEVSTGKKASSAEYAAPLAMDRQLSSRAEITLRCNSQKNVRGVRRTRLFQHYLGDSGIVGAIGGADDQQMLAGF